MHRAGMSFKDIPFAICFFGTPVALSALASDRCVSSNTPLTGSLTSTNLPLGFGTDVSVGDIEASSAVRFFVKGSFNFLVTFFFSELSGSLRLDWRLPTAFVNSGAFVGDVEFGDFAIDEPLASFIFVGEDGFLVVGFVTFSGLGGTVSLLGSEATWGELGALTTSSSKAAGAFVGAFAARKPTVSDNVVRGSSPLGVEGCSGSFESDALSGVGGGCTCGDCEDEIDFVFDWFVSTVSGTFVGLSSSASVSLAFTVSAVCEGISGTGDVGAGVLTGDVSLKFLIFICGFNFCGSCCGGCMAVVCSLWSRSAGRDVGCDVSGF